MKLVKTFKFIRTDGQKANEYNVVIDRMFKSLLCVIDYNDIPAFGALYAGIELMTEIMVDLSIHGHVDWLPHNVITIENHCLSFDGLEGTHFITPVSWTREMFQNWT